jgi:MATE family multidrug resistance protein
MVEIGYGKLIRFALPIMLSGFIQSIISITDAAFLSRYSTLAYNASGSAGLWYITLFMVLIGLSDGAQIGMAQKVGEGDKNGFAAFFQSNFVILILAASCLSLFVIFFMPAINNYIVHDVQMAKAQQSFLTIRSYAFWAATVSLTIQASYLAVGKTKLVLFSALIVAGSNIVLDYLLVFGIGVFPELGLEGAAIASTLAEVLGMLFLFGTLYVGNMSKVYALFQQSRVTLNQLKINLNIGIPLLFQGLIALSIWTLFFSWIAQMGNKELSISLNIRYIYFLAFIPVWGFAATTKTYIAQYIGAKDYKMLPIIQKRIQLLTVLFLFITFHGALFYPELLIKLVNNNPYQIKESALILRIISGSILIYGIGSVYFQTISGSGNTRVTFLVEILATTAYISAAYLFIKIWHLPLYQVWLVEYVYFIVMALASLAYLRFFNWTKEKVHE